MPHAKPRRLPFDTTNCRRHFRRVIAQQDRARQERMRRARQARTPLPPPPSPGDPTRAPNATEWLRLSTGDAPLSAMDAMRWLQMSPTQFYLWRQRLDIHPIVKRQHLALYARQDLLRLHAAYLAHARTEETHGA